MATIEHDDPVVVIIGSGAGGGTIAHELTTKGVKCVLLEAGPHLTADDYVNDEWPAFSQMAWLDMRTTSGSWRVARDFPNLPTWIVKAVGGTTTHWAGATPRFMEHEFRIRSVYGDLDGANMLDWPITLEELAPWYDKAEIAMGTTHRHGRAPLPANNNYTVMANGAERAGYRYYATGPYATNAEPYDGRPASVQDGFNFQGDKHGSKWSTLVREIPRAMATGNLDLRPLSQAVKITHDDSGTSTPSNTSTPQAPAPAGRESGVRGGQLDRVAATAADERELPASGRPRELVRAGRPQLHAAHDRLGLRAVREAGADVPGRDHGRDRRRRGEARYVPRLRRRLLHGDPLARPGLPGQLHRTGGVGPQLHREDGRLRAHRRDVAGRRGPAAGVEPGHAEPRCEGPVGAAGAGRALRRPPERRRDARPRLRGSRTPFTVRPGRLRCTTPRRTRRRTTSAPAG